MERTKPRAELGLIVELHIGPDYGAQVAPVIAAHPDTPVLIDHLAEPHMGTAVEYAQVLALAQYDHVYMKLSGLNHFSQDAPLYLETRPFTRTVIDAFGPHRLVWGSGTPAIVLEDGTLIGGYLPPAALDARLEQTNAHAAN